MRETVCHVAFLLAMNTTCKVMSCQEDRGIYANGQRLMLFDKERPTHEFEQTLKNFCCLLNPEKQHVASCQ